jgi:hypothetical protein
MPVTPTLLDRPCPWQPPASWPLLPSKIANGGRDDALTVVSVMQISQRGALLETAAAAVRLHDRVHLHGRQPRTAKAVVIPAVTASV